MAIALTDDQWNRLQKAVFELEEAYDTESIERSDGLSLSLHYHELNVVSEARRVVAQIENDILKRKN